ncbi:MAG: ferrous iron transport protein A [PVC group bacterium]|nr:ferrous iron transport protein A [PVC group bacterium]
MENIYKLSEVPAGNYYVVDINSDGTRFSQRMVQLGLYKSVEIKKYKNSKKKGPILIKLKGSVYTIGQGRAEKIYVVKK